ncbi:MAG: hypothetical protein KIT18_12280, partial [Burkholderiales bacterium]|nr:hypothetical protein [Burkholderiales bacterium]
GLGLTRDPYLSVGDENMWVNAGRQQFHLPSRGIQVLRGRIGLVVPDLDALTARLSGVRGKLAETRFAFAAEGDHVAVTCPWGNRLRCHAPRPGSGGMTLGISYVEFDVRCSTAPGIAYFYERTLGVKVVLSQNKSCATVPAGPGQSLIFRETDDPLPAFDGHHIAIYVADFSGPHRFLKQHDLVTEESDEHQYRFQDIFDFDTGAKLFEVGHEVRSLRHPLWGRSFVNRNPAQTQRAYVPGRDAYAG